MPAKDLFWEIKYKIPDVVFVPGKELSLQCEECNSRLLAVPIESLSEGGR